MAFTAGQPQAPPKPINFNINFCGVADVGKTTINERLMTGKCLYSLLFALDLPFLMPFYSH